MDKHIISYYAGIFIVFASHIYVLTQSASDSMKMHSYANIFAVFLIAYYFMNREGFIAY
jgi:hypothetical protein